MTVFVDTMKAKYRNMIMCHMVADTDEELHAMADLIGVNRKWHQKAGTEHSHYDICLKKKALAIAEGAKEISRRDLVLLIRKKRIAIQS